LALNYESIKEKKMSVKIASSSNPDIIQAIQEVKKNIQSSDSRLIVYFSSMIYNQEELAKEMKEAFIQANVIGCSTAGELISGKMLNNSVVVMSLDSASIKDVKVEVIENLKENPDPQASFDSFEKYFGQAVSKLDFKKYYGLVLIDGLSNSEETLMERIGTKTSVHFIGGSAGDDLQFKKTYIYANGKVYSNAAVLALVKSNTEFDILKTQSFSTLSKTFVATKVNEEQREVLELDGVDAVEKYASAINKSKEDVPASFMTYPLGVMIDDEPFVRSPQQLSGNGIKFYCNIAEGTELTLLESKDIVDDTKKAVQKKLREFGNISGLINFNCILRTLELKAKKQEDAYGMIFKDIPTIGFSTYGEEYIGHINQTSVMLVLK
jgi:hypothetical protein